VGFLFVKSILTQTQRTDDVNYSLLSTFAQVSRKPTVLLKTNFSAEESLSTQ
jgi:hypothetical protein